jgi:endogenous inhibitor of DNA gyrase (YacG/DUF329 family)
VGIHSYPCPACDAHAVAKLRTIRQPTIGLWLSVSFEEFCLRPDLIRSRRGRISVTCMACGHKLNIHEELAYYSFVDKLLNTRARCGHS